MGRKKQKWVLGDVFKIRLENSNFSIGQIIAYEKEIGSVFCALYKLSFNDDKMLLSNELMTSENLVSAIFTTSDLLENGKWEIITNMSIENKALLEGIVTAHRRKQFIGTDIQGSGLVEDFLNAYFGLTPWDDWANPTYLDEFLINMDKKPSNLIYVKR